MIAPYVTDTLLRAGDIVIEIGGQAVETLDRMAPATAWHAGETITYRVIREGSVIDVPVRLGAGTLDPAR